MNPQTPTSLGIRVPAHDLARAILRQTGPLATTSANRSGQAALLDPGAIAQQFPAAWVLDPSLNPKPGSGQASTVARWTPMGWQILRQGAILRSLAKPIAL
jgi:L-threonylcarbamoyladenylate synthase